MRTVSKTQKCSLDANTQCTHKSITPETKFTGRQKFSNILLHERWANCNAEMGCTFISKAHAKLPGARFAMATGHLT